MTQNQRIFFCSTDKSRQNVPSAGHLQRGPSGVPPAGPPHQQRVVVAQPRPKHCSGPVYWNLTQPVHTVLAKPTYLGPALLFCRFCTVRLLPQPIVDSIRVKLDEQKEQNEAWMKDFGILDVLGCPLPGTVL